MGDRGALLYGSGLFAYIERDNANLNLKGALFSMAAFESFQGIVTAIDDFWTDAQGPSGCFKLMAVRDRSGSPVNFVISPDTYFVDQAVIRVRDGITGFYDPNVPVPMIYPPQYRALVVAGDTRGQTVTVDHFDARLISSDGMLRLNITRSTRVLLVNGQPFTGNPGNRNLVVVYRISQPNIPRRVLGMPLLVTPIQVVVLC